MAVINSIKKEILKSEFFLHQTKRSVLIKFISLLLVLVSYFGFVSYKYGLNNGFLVTILTWSFFVFCTPIADAGFLLDFPIRLITKLRMVYSEMMVWSIAILINTYALFFRPEVYEKVFLLRLFKEILLNPVPFWVIILISAFGTFLSIYFGDEMIDVVSHKEREKYKKHKNKYTMVIIAFIIAVMLVFYVYTLNELSINIPFL